MTNLLFEPPLSGLRGNLRTLFIARWRARSQLPIRDNWTFFASSYGRDVISRYWSKSALFGLAWVTFSANFRWKGTSSPAIRGVRKLECFSISHWRPRDPIFIRLRVTDGQTDGRTNRRTELPWLIQRSALQAMRPRCKNRPVILEL